MENTKSEKLRETIDDFFCWHNYEEARRLLEEMLLAALSNPDVSSWTTEERTDIIFLYKKICSLLSDLNKSFISTS